MYRVRRWNHDRDEMIEVFVISLEGIAMDGYVSVTWVDDPGGNSRCQHRPAENLSQNRGRGHAADRRNFSRGAPASGGHADASGHGNRNPNLNPPQGQEARGVLALCDPCHHNATAESPFQSRRSTTNANCLSPQTRGRIRKCRFSQSLCKGPSAFCNSFHITSYLTRKTSHPPSHTFCRSGHPGRRLPGRKPRQPQRS